MTAIEADSQSKKILAKEYVRRLAPDESGGYVASILEFPGCVAEGETAEEALTNLDNAAESWINVALANGYHVRAPINFDGCNGKIALRMPRTLHKQAAELAELEGCSLNQLLVTAIASYVGGQQLISKFEELTQSIKRDYYVLCHVQLSDKSFITGTDVKKTLKNFRPERIVNTVENKKTLFLEQ